MPEQQTIERAQRAKRQGKSPSSQAGEFVREEIRHIRKGEHGARNTKQAIAIGLSQARKSGVPLKPPRRGQTSEATRKSAKRAYAQGQSGHAAKPSPRRSRATQKALERESRSAASRANLSHQARRAAKSRSAQARRAAAKKAVHTKGTAGRRAAAQKAARTRKRKSR